MAEFLVILNVLVSEQSLTLNSELKLLLLSLLVLLFLALFDTSVDGISRSCAGIEFRSLLNFPVLRIC